MIGKLKGIVDEIGEDHAVIDCGGVGYVAFCGARTLRALPPVGEATVLFVETFLREDMLRLYGFGSEAERGWFRLLQNVQGVGARLALAVLGTLSTSELANAVALGDRATVSRAPGVGPKVAARIVTELKDEIPSFSAASLDLPAAALAPVGGASTPVTDAISALANLGYPREQAAIAVAGAAKDAGENAAAPTLIRLALKSLSR